MVPINTVSCPAASCIDAIKFFLPGLRISLGATALLALSACANLHTINRTTDLPNNGKAIHLDAPQRVIYVMADGKACAEPTPDALQSYISSFGGTLNAGVDSASISNALSANATSVGLHSQSITLMREHLFNICQYAQNSWLNDADVMLLMERSQDLTLGVLAIEQLTGAVVARPATASVQSNSTAAAKERLTAASDALATQAQLDLATKKEHAMQNHLATLRTAPARQPTPMLKTALDEQSSSDADDDSTNAELSDARNALAQAHAERGKLVAQLDEQLSKNQATASSTAAINDAVRLAPVSDSTADRLATASTEIVRMVLNKGHLTDMCITFMNHPKKHPEGGQHYKDVMEQCKTVLIEDMRITHAQETATAPPASAVFLSAPIHLDDGAFDDTPSILKKPASKIKKDKH